MLVGWGETLWSVLRSPWTDLLLVELHLGQDRVLQLCRLILKRWSSNCRPHSHNTRGILGIVTVELSQDRPPQLGRIKLRRWS